MQCGKSVTMLIIDTIAALRNNSGAKSVRIDYQESLSTLR
ncbi:hypothetical protein SAMN05216386_0875 [Nitrosospira briensis]|uniref:Uncharacterized protein n=1 Tax=Nitrosospira briensis TaxID=35799 RepID=A0A1I4YT55_9PROT|nr:hypothetical protein SAMN05216386_0875 [Nitrosospira briensis]SFN76435.1 hypothetical protein SAMN05216332_101529 [Nitrosospira briensis]